MRLFNKFNFALHSTFTLLPYPTSILYSYWTSQPDKRIIFGSLKQGKHLHHYHNIISIWCFYWTSQPDRRATFGDCSKVNIWPLPTICCTTSIWCSYWTSQPELSYKSNQNLTFHTASKSVLVSSRTFPSSSVGCIPLSSSKEKGVWTRYRST